MFEIIGAIVLLLVWCFIHELIWPPISVPQDKVGRILL